MSSQHDTKGSAEVVDIARLLKKPTQRKVLQPIEFRASASLLSIRQKLVCIATVGVDDIDRIAKEFPNDVTTEVNALLRRLLNKEFGSLRVYKHRRVFTVGHHCQESMMAGLLRVQYHANQFDTRAVKPGVLREGVGLQITWGVGDTVPEAEKERSKRRALKLP